MSLFICFFASLNWIAVVFFRSKLWRFGNDVLLQCIKARLRATVVLTNMCCVDLLLSSLISSIAYLIYPAT